MSIALLALVLAVARAAAPLPPPPPVPAPADWAADIASGDLLFWGGAAPPPGHYPSVGNGYVAKAVGPWHSVGAENDFGSFYLAGVFSGVGNTTPSHRAAIPDLADVRLTTGAPLGAALDLRGGAFLNRTLVHAPACAGVQIQSRTYAHRAERSLFVVELRARAAGGGAWPAGGCALTLDWAFNASSSPDFAAATLAPGAPGGPAVLSLVALAAETPGAPPRRVAVALPAWLAAARGAPNATFAAPDDALFAAIVLRSDLDAADPAAAAAADWARLTALGADALLASHTAAWAALWAGGGIELEGNATVAAAANSSLYAILSALRADVNFSTCPGGLATNSYSGHTFWVRAGRRRGRERPRLARASARRRLTPPPHHRLPAGRPPAGSRDVDVSAAAAPAPRPRGGRAAVPPRPARRRRGALARVRL
jgi:hypothetical protein